MWNKLRRTVAPTSPIIDLDEAQVHLRVDGDDDLIERLVAAATTFVEGPNGIGGITELR
jgi:hypothetical protein